MTADASPYREGLAEQRAELDEVRSQITDARAQLVDLQRERQDSRDHRTPLVPPRVDVRCEGPHLARGLW